MSASYDKCKVNLNYFIIFQIWRIIHANNPMISKPQILYMNPQTSMQIIRPPIISHSATFTIIPLVIGFHICFFRKNETVLTSPAIANSAKSADITTKPIFCIKPSLCIQVVWIQKRSIAPSTVIYNANNVPIIRNEPICILCDVCFIT